MKKHFTLTEILVVVFLIGVLTAIGFGMYSYAMNFAKENGTRALLSRIGAALDTCNTKLGYIPTTIESGNTPTFKEIRFEIDSDGTIKSITFDESEEVSDDYRNEFVKTIDAENLKKNLVKKESNTYILVDNWGQTIYYAYPGKFNKTGYDLYSAGADGRMGKDAENLNVGTLNGHEKAEGFIKENNEMLCDDICNF